MRILIADNNSTNSLVAKLILEREYHKVKVASNGAEAVIALQSEHFDVLLLDIVMPVMDGFQTVQYLKNIPSKPNHVFALSAYDSEKDVALYQAAGFNGLIAKPLRPGDLRAAMSMGRGNYHPSLIGAAANVQDAGSRPLLDETVYHDGPGQADEFTRERIWQSYHTGLSASLKDIARALPGYLEQDKPSRETFLNALHSLRSASLTVGLNRAPYLAKELREAPADQIVNGVARLLHAVRDSLPALESVLLDVSRQAQTPSVTPR